MRSSPQDWIDQHQPILFENQKRMWTILGEVFEDKTVELFLDTFKDNFSNNLNNKKLYYAVNFYIRPEPKHTLIQISIDSNKKTGYSLNQTAPYTATHEQVEIYLGFEHHADAEDFANNTFWAFHGYDYKVEIYK
ncbi:MAG: hypothetical protein HC836_37645 [Richelia sp. RM2_1_2]|nr:hypothetical protein [Richelia sp. RM2_1_2]